MNATIRSIDVGNSEQVIEFVWSDGLQTKLPLFGLRKNCPCVECRGGHDRMGTYELQLFFVDPLREYRILKAEVVGNHALKIHWDDGHTTGMYRWELLRSLCKAVEEARGKSGEDVQG